MEVNHSQAERLLCARLTKNGMPCRNYRLKGYLCCRWHAREETAKEQEEDENPGPNGEQLERQAGTSERERNERQIKRQLKEKELAQEYSGDELGGQGDEKEKGAEVGLENLLDSQLDGIPRQDNALVSHNEELAREARQRSNPTLSARSNPTPHQTQYSQRSDSNNSTFHRIQFLQQRETTSSTSDDNQTQFLQRHIETPTQSISPETSPPQQPTSVSQARGHKAIRSESKSPNCERRKKPRRMSVEDVSMSTKVTNSHHASQDLTEDRLQEEFKQTQWLRNKLDLQDQANEQRLVAKIKEITDQHLAEMKFLEQQLQDERGATETLIKRHREDLNTALEEFELEKQKQIDDNQRDLQRKLDIKENLHDKKIRDLEATHEKYLTEERKRAQDDKENALSLREHNLGIRLENELENQKQNLLRDHRIEIDNVRREYEMPIVEVQNEVKELKTKLATSIQENNAARARYKEEEKLSKSLQAELASIKKENTAIQARYDEAMAENRALKEEIVNAQTEFTNLKTAFMNTQRSIVEIQAKYNELATGVGDLNVVKGKVMNVQAQLADASMELEKAKKGIVEAEEEAQDFVVTAQRWWHSVRDNALKLVRTLSESDEEKRRVLLVEATEGSMKIDRSAEGQFGRWL